MRNVKYIFEIDIEIHDFYDYFCIFVLKQQF